MSTQWQDQSGTIPTGGSASPLEADPNRHGIFFANRGTHAMDLSIGATLIPVAAGDTVFLPPQSDSKWCPMNAVTVTGTAGDAYALASW